MRELVNSKFWVSKVIINGNSNWFATLIGKLAIFCGFCPLCNGITWNDWCHLSIRLSWSALLLDSLSAVLHMQNDNWRDSIWSTKYKSVIVHNIWGQEKGWALVSVNIYPCRLICVCMLVHNAKHATVAVMGWRLQHCNINKPSPYKSVTKISSEAESK